MRVLIGIPTRGEGSPSPFFWQCVCDLRPIPGVQVLPPFVASSGVIPGTRNQICRKALEVGADYVWMLDDDQPFAPDDLAKLLAHDKDIVVPLSLRRGKPFAPLIYDRIDEQGGAHQHYLTPFESGLIPVAGAGLAGVLIKRTVLDALGDPWFAFERSHYNGDDYAEDFPFYRRVAEAGFTVYCDLDVRFGHRITAYVWPVKQNGVWMTAMADDAPFAFAPQPQSPLTIAR